MNHINITKQRNSNLELYRIIVMLLIVAHHYVVNSGIYSEIQLAEEFSTRNLFYLLFGAWGKIGINCFVLITGYFMCTSCITLRKYIKLLFEVFFYDLLLTLIFHLSSYHTMTFLEFIYALLPVKSISDGFTSCFILFYLFIPFLNILVKNLNNQQHLLLCVLMLFSYTILGTIPKLQVTMNYVSWFCVLYFIASYFRLYPISNKYDKWLGVVALSSFIISMLSIIVCYLISLQINRFIPYWFVVDSNRILALITGVTSFLYFKNLKIGYSKIINMMGASTFGVLLIHANSDSMRHWLWRDTFNNIGWFTSEYCYIHAVVSVIIIFLICVLIDQMRIRLIEIPLLRKMDTLVKNSKYKKIWNNK